MSDNIDEFLTFRTKTRKQIEERENQWKIDEQGLRGRFYGNQIQRAFLEVT